MTDHPLLVEMAEIESTLLSGVSSSPPDPLSPRERTLTRAYLLVAHAILEERIEGIFFKHFMSARELIATGASMPIGLLPYYAAAMEWKRDIPTYSKRNWLGFMSSAVAHEYVANEVRQNHGLKADNVQDLAKLVGVEWSAIDEAADVQLAALTTLGVKRGAAGHTSPFTTPAQVVAEEEYPANVREWVEQAVRTVIALESVVEHLSAAGPREVSSSEVDGVNEIMGAGVEVAEPGTGIDADAGVAPTTSTEPREGTPTS